MTWVETRGGEKKMKSSQKENGKTSFLTLEDDEYESDKGEIFLSLLPPTSTFHFGRFALAPWENLSGKINRRPLYTADSRTHEGKKTKIDIIRPWRVLTSPSPPFPHHSTCSDNFSFTSSAHLLHVRYYTLFFLLLFWTGEP